MTLRGWSTLGHDALVQLVNNYDGRIVPSFEEKQLLEAARERLITWRAPTRTNRRATMNQEKKIEDQTATTKEVVGTFVEDAVKAKDKAEAAVETAKTDKKPAPKAQKKTAAPKVQKPKTETKTETKPNTKETKMAKKSTKKAAPAKAKSNGAGGKRISDDAVLRVSKGFKNPYPEGSGPFKRFDICSKSAGKTYGALRSMASLKPTTALNFVRAGGGHFEGK